MNEPLDQREVARAALDLYDSAAQDYERQLLHDCRYQTPERITQLFRRVEAASGDDAPWLDLGAGTGLMGQALQTAGISLDLFAIDISREMLSRIRCPAYQACWRADALEPLDIVPASVAGAFAVGLSEHVVDLGQLFACVSTYLRRNGWLFFSFCPSRAAAVDRESSGLLAHAPSRVRERLRHHGFEPVAEQEIDAYQSGPGGWAVHSLVAARKSG